MIKKVKNLSIQKKIILWFSAMLLIIVLLISGMTFAIAASALNENIKERLFDVVSSNIDEIEYVKNGSQAEASDRSQFLLYGEGLLEIDDNFCDVFEGISTALYDSDGNLLYGSAPLKSGISAAPTFTKIEKIEYKGENYYIYDKLLTADDMQGLWLRGIVSQNESINILYNVIRLSFWLLPLLALLAVFGGYIITRRSFLPVEQIARRAEEISHGSDLSKRLDIGTGDDEIHMLADTFNEMLARLEKSFIAEKRFTSDVSHELRTPTAVILAQTQYALELADSEEEYRESFEVINRQANHMSEIISRLLFFTRLEQGTETVCKESVCISELLLEFCKERSMLSSCGICLSTDIEPDIWIDTDRRLLLIVLSNLFGNACKYGKENGNIYVSLHRQGGSARISVKDDGIGISRENLEKIWQRFYQEDSSRSKNTHNLELEKSSIGDTVQNGIGLGLSLVKEICKLLDIKIAADSTEGVGSEFTLIL